jgi:hypothetical protein
MSRTKTAGVGDGLFMDAGVEAEPRWRLVPVKGNMKELFEGEEVLAESSDAEEDAELEKKPLFVYESWLAEAARKKVRRTHTHARARTRTRTRARAHTHIQKCESFAVAVQALLARALLHTHAHTESCVALRCARAMRAQARSSTPVIAMR